MKYNETKQHINVAAQREMLGIFQCIKKELNLVKLIHFKL